MQRAGIVAILLLSAALAAGLAASVNFAFGRILAPSEPAEAVVASEPAVAGASPAPGAAERPRVMSEDAWLSAIRKRNIFDPLYIDTYNPAARAGGPGVPVTDLKLKLLATVVARPEAFSSALISGDAGASGYGVGEEIRGTGARVVTIEADRVKIRGADGVESFLLMEQEAHLSAGGATEPTGEAPAGAEGVEQLGENKFAISKDTLAKYMSDPSQLATMGRALLHRGTDGEYDGYRLSAIRRGTLADALGIKNGDVVHAVNGQSMNSMQAAMTAGQSLAGGAGNFQIEVSRRGQRMTLEYEVR